MEYRSSSRAFDWGVRLQDTGSQRRDPGHPGLEFLHFRGELDDISTEAALWMLCFGFVSGHDFSRAVKDGKRIGLQPLVGRALHEMLVKRRFCVVHAYFSRRREGAWKKRRG